MKVLLITAAGTSSRFSHSLGKPCLKCIYSPADITESLLYRMLRRDTAFDKYIIVGGFMYEQLERVLEQDFSEFGNRIVLVRNEKYEEYGSGYSLYQGLQEAMKLDFDEVIFAEGDLYVDEDSFREVSGCVKDVITCSSGPILADKAVAFYYDREYRIHYIYDTSHSMLEIKEPFRGIFHSGQVWKFAQSDRVRRTYADMEEQDWQGTNLVFVEKYFQMLAQNEYELVQFKQWINCNTIADFEKIPHGTARQNKTEK